MKTDLIVKLLAVNWPLSISSLLYLIECLICFQHGKYGQALMFVCYAGANIGILWSLA
jgi:hypothetical protein